MQVVVDGAARATGGVDAAAVTGLLDALDDIDRDGRYPAIDVVRRTPAGDGVSLVNIGVRPSNAKTITDHVAVLRLDTMMMIGHCGGLRNHLACLDRVRREHPDGLPRHHVRSDDEPLFDARPRDR